MFPCGVFMPIPSVQYEKTRQNIRSLVCNTLVSYYMFPVFKLLVRVIFHHNLREQHLKGRVYILFLYSQTVGVFCILDQRLGKAYI